MLDRAQGTSQNVQITNLYFMIMDIHTTKARKAPHKMLINYANYDDSHKVNYIQLPSN